MSEPTIEERLARLEQRVTSLQEFIWSAAKDRRDQLNQASWNQDALLKEMAGARLNDHLPTFMELRTSIHKDCVVVNEPCPCACGTCGNTVVCRCFSPVCTDCVLSIARDDETGCAIPSEVLR